jgi:hypothetical protein
MHQPAANRNGRIRNFADIARHAKSGFMEVETNMKNILILALMTATMTFAADAERLQAMAKAANTTTAHSEVARGYVEFADTLEAKAAKHEKEAERLAKAAESNPLRQKWPAMASAPAERERRLAMQARRAASEARTTALKHKSLAEPTIVTND